MCPKEAKIFIAEDSRAWGKILKRVARNAHHTVVAIATDLQTGLSMISDIKKLEVNVALVDGSLPRNPNDGDFLAQTLRHQIPDIKIIDVSF